FSSHSRGRANERSAIEHARARAHAGALKQPARRLDATNVVVLPQEVDPPGGVFGDQRLQRSIHIHSVSSQPEQGTGNREQGTGKREQGTGNSEQGTGNREQRTGNSVHPRHYTVAAVRKAVSRNKRPLFPAPCSR